MNSKQVAVMETVATKEWLKWKCVSYFDGEMEFSHSMIGDKVFVHATNVKTIKGFQKLLIVQFMIGVRGGISKLKVIK